MTFKPWDYAGGIVLLLLWLAAAAAPLRYAWGGLANGETIAFLVCTQVLFGALTWQFSVRGLQRWR